MSPGVIDLFFYEAKYAKEFLSLMFSGTMKYDL